MAQSSAKARSQPSASPAELTRSARSSQNYSFGSITSTVTVDGDIDRSNQLVDHMLSAITAVISVEAIQQGLSGKSELGVQQVENIGQQMCEATVKFGNISLKVEMAFRLDNVPNRVLNSIVFGAILPKVWEAASIYLGDYKDLTSPPTPLTQVSHGRVLRDIDNALALGYTEDEDTARTSQRARHAMTH